MPVTVTWRAKHMALPYHSSWAGALYSSSVSVLESAQPQVSLFLAQTNMMYVTVNFLLCCRVYFVAALGKKKRKVWMVKMAFLLKSTALITKNVLSLLKNKRSANCLTWMWKACCDATLLSNVIELCCWGEVCVCADIVAHNARTEATLNKVPVRNARYFSPLIRNVTMR